ncbi:MAG: carboxypeptidase regulatory-like domain-containing protein [Proteobacteria bacterium]|nr:carboxypeptidase regulatory-like domain-containing protein [Pseudomonadota bacterium]
MKAKWLVAQVIGLLAVHGGWASPTVSSEYATGKVGRSEMLSAKRGTVIDAATGAGIADATVIASWHISATGWERNGGGCVVRSIVHTDANGIYSLPDVSADQWFHPPKATVSERIHALAGYTSFAWYLAVFKPGYLREGDAETLARDTFMNPTFPDWQWTSPKTFATRDGYRVATIKLTKDNLPPAQEILYLATVNRFADCHPNPLPPASPEYDALVKQLRQIVRPIPCSLSATTPIPAAAAEAFEGLDGGGDSKTEKFFYYGQGNADTFAKRISDATRGGPYGRRDTNAGTLCWAQGGRETRP